MSDRDKRQEGRNRRRNYVINPSFQWKYATTIALAVFFISSILSSGLYAVLHQQARMRFVDPEGSTGTVALTVLFAALVFSALTAAGVAFWSIVATHRICGPLYVLERQLTELANGRFPSPRKLRRKDEFKELFSVLCDAIETLKAGKQYELVVLDEVLSEANTATDADDEGRKAALETVVRHLTALRRKAVEALGDETPSTSVAPVSRPAPSGRTPVSVG